MDVRTRLAAAVLGSGVPLHRSDVEREVIRLARSEAPLAPEELLRRVVDDLVGLGPLEGLLADDQVTDVLVNGPREVWVDRGGSLERTDVAFSDERELVAAIERVITPLGLRLDRSSPIVDARLPDGSRLHAVVPPATPDGPILAIRRFTEAITDLDGLVRSGSVDRAQADHLGRLVAGRRNILVSGGTGTGKTTLLNVLSRSIPESERTVIVEDASELRTVGHRVRLEAQPANAEGRGAVSLDQLVRAALRLRPDRIIVGEVRGPEALDLVAALNTGHAGSMSTIHANGPDEALLRLETLALSGSRRPAADAVRRQIEMAVDVVVQLARTGGRRRVVEIRELR
ncbi:MAG TPA: ATPase, T2SS/T4P/T4SS family [Acidimicrobiia bacterium]|nr:ATPase, T2SS/T4P/T4SS family [Acidimicrobiia bacterium]